MKHFKKSVEGWKYDRNIMPYINTFINTNLTDDNPGFFDINKYASLGKKRKRPKTIKKYKYKKNKTGKRKNVKKEKRNNNT